jgi:hypothetical protein
MDVIRFLEAVGSKPLHAAEYAAAVGSLELDVCWRRALMEGDQSSLNDLLGGRRTMCCLVVAAETIQ